MARGLGLGGCIGFARWRSGEGCRGRKQQGQRQSGLEVLVRGEKEDQSQLLLELVVPGQWAQVALQARQQAAEGCFILGHRDWAVACHCDGEPQKLVHRFLFLFGSQVHRLRLIITNRFLPPSHSC